MDQKSLNSCAFNNDRYCLLSDNICQKKCNKYTMQYPKFEFRDYIDLLYLKTNQRNDLIIRWIMICITVCSVVIALISLLYKSNSTIQVDCISGNCIISNSSTLTPLYTITIAMPSLTPIKSIPLTITPTKPIQPNSTLVPPQGIQIQVNQTLNSSNNP
jgi:hypothetical protein